MNQEATNPLLAGIKKIPGISIPLPTRAFLYENGELAPEAQEIGEVHVHPMSARDELTLKSPDLLLNGEGIARVIKKCVPEIINPRDLYQPDVDAILIGLRIATYGEKLGIRVSNPHYNTEVEGSMKELSFDIDLKSCLQKGSYLESKDDCIVHLETGQTAIVQPIKMGLAVRLAQEDLEQIPEENIARNQMFKKRMDSVVDVMLSMISEVDGIKDREMIKEWYEKVPAKVFKGISNRAGEISSIGPLLKTAVKDPISGESWDTDIPIDPATFFDFGPSKGITNG